MTLKSPRHWPLNTRNKIVNSVKLIRCFKCRKLFDQSGQKHSPKQKESPPRKIDVHRFYKIYFGSLFICIHFNAFWTGTHELHFVLSAFMISLEQYVNFNCHYDFHEIHISENCFYELGWNVENVAQSILSNGQDHSQLLHCSLQH